MTKVVDVATMSFRINQRLKDVVGSATLAITARANELKAQGKDVVNFAAGEPDFDTPQDIKDAAIKAIQSGFTKYTPTVGTADLRQAISAKFKKDNNLTYTPNQIVVSCGAKHSIYNIIQVLVDEGDEVIIPAPYWVSYPEMVKCAGGKSRFVTTTPKTGLKMTAEQLAANINDNTRLVILNSPSNPTGMVYSKEELKRIADICVKHNIFVISDDIYEKLIYDESGFTSIASLGKEINDLTITVNGVSKAYSMTGWRIGYCAGPQEAIDYIKKFQDHSTSNPTSISQAAALQALRATGDSVETMRKEFKRRRDLMASLVDKISGISYLKPQGAFYLFCDISKLKLGEAHTVAQKILDETHVALIPGESFGAPGYLRLSFATSSERIEEGLKRISDWIKRAK